MALFALSDLHLSYGIDKPMDVFGSAWYDYMNRISQNWKSAITNDDLVVIGGDLSWATYLDEAKPDFEFLNSLPGKKLLVKGNHDYWWESVTKLKNCMLKNSFDTIEFLHNNSFVYNDCLISGTRFWLTPGTDGFGKDDHKIYDRELARLCLSLDEAKKQEEAQPLKDFEKIVCLHYPPVSADGRVDDGILGIFKKYNVKKCIYGHLHGGGLSNAFCGVTEGIEFKLTSADYLDFTPLKLWN
ncbi:MAG: metallophosphoesterase [Clostridia bacterium]|nr:metallophosphoesterase [Clostridia bacterium]